MFNLMYESSLTIYLNTNFFDLMKFQTSSLKFKISSMKFVFAVSLIYILNVFLFKIMK